MNETIRFTADKLESKDLRLLADGAGRIGSLPFDQTTEFQNVPIREFRVYKEPGDGKPLTLTSPLGSVSATWENGRWVIVSDHPEFLEIFTNSKGYTPVQPGGIPSAYARPENAMRNAPPVLGYEEETPYPIPGPIQPPKQRNTAGIIATGIVIAIVLVASIFAFRPFIGTAVDEWRAEAQAKRDEEKARRDKERREKEYEKLHNAIAPLHTNAQDELAQFDALVRPFFSEVEALAGSSVERVVADDVPKKINEAHRFVEEFRAPWTAIVNACSATKKAQVDLRKDLNALSKKLADRTLLEEDNKAVDTLRTAIKAARTTVEARGPDIRAVQSILDQRERDAFFATQGRRTP